MASGVGEGPGIPNLPLGNPLGEAPRHDSAPRSPGWRGAGRHTPDPVRLSPGQFDRIAQALADPRRLSLLPAIPGNDECPYQKLCHEVPVSKATISHHPEELVRAGLVESVRDGQQMHATLRPEVLEAHTRKLGPSATAEIHAVQVGSRGSLFRDGSLAGPPAVK